MTMQLASISKGERSITADYFVQENVDGSKVMASLSIHHHKDRKCFSATLNRVTLSQNRGYTTRAFWLLDGAVITRIPVARYSAKALEAAFEDATITLKLLYKAGDQKVLEIFSEKEEVAV
jgi:hypothetical protein